jgi:hypothetical protein
MDVKILLMDKQTKEEIEMIVYELLYQAFFLLRMKSAK